MSQPQILTYFDALASLEDFATGAAESSVAPASLRRAVQSAYREIVSERDWRCMIRNGRIHLKAAQTTGTITYDHATREVTLTGSTWPDWAQDASIRIDDTVCDVETRDSDTVLTLDATLNPGADVAAGSAYRIYPRYYVLPADFASLDGTREKSSWKLGQYVSPGELFTLDQYDDQTGDLRYYTIAPVQDLYGSLGLYCHPASDTSEPLDIAYKRRPRDLRYTGHDAADFAGTISIASGSASAVGISTAFTAAHVGSIIRLGTSTTVRPTGMEGAAPWTEERSIAAVTDATHITLDAAVTNSYTGVKYVITDPVDLDISLHDAFLRCCEKHLAFSRSFEGRGETAAIYEAALFRAKCADGRDNSIKVAGVRVPQGVRLRDMKGGRTIE